jgi:hypothetical protein
MMQSGLPTNPAPTQTTTKPRQMPGGSQPAPGTFDPAMNGGNVGVGADVPPAGAPDPGPRVAAIAEDIRRSNPGMSPRLATRLAGEVFDRYLSKVAWADDPLAYTSWTDVDDGNVLKRLRPGQHPKAQRPKGRGKPLGPQQPDRPEGVEPDDHLDPDDDSEWERENGSYETLAEPQAGGGDPIDLSDYERPAEPPQADQGPSRGQRVRQQVREQAGPTMKRLIREHGPEVAKAMWQMRKR